MKELYFDSLVTDETKKIINTDQKIYINLLIINHLE